jgi:hypothetical protein
LVLPHQIGFNRLYVAFIVINKTCPSDIIVNGIKGLSILTSNVNNLPFQIKWKLNRIYHKRDIEKIVEQFISSINVKPSWKDVFINGIKDIKFNR